MRWTWLFAALFVALTAVAWSQAPADSGDVHAEPDSLHASRPDSSAAGTDRQVGGLRVLRAYVCKEIEESEPAEAGRSFLSPDDGILRLCCFSEIAAAEPDTVLHVWYWGDREMARVPLEVRGPRWRTWSTKRIIEAWRGDWHVEITTRQGDVLERLEFSVE
jgi:hypothetical protein